jgi:hypothetical protein
MKLSALASAQNSLSKPNHSILIYGPPKTGKTELVGTAAKIPEIKRIFWLDGENGSETLLHMGLTVEEMDKIHLIRIPDTRETPRFIETVLKLFSSKTPVTVCDAHGKVGCVECKDKEGTIFCMKDLTNSDLVVVDSGSQLGDSALALACLGKDISYKPGFDEYGMMGKWLSDILSHIQSATYTNFVLITHEIVVEEEVNGVKRDKILPLVGTKAFCFKVAKYFGTVVYVEIKMGKHAAGSGSTYKPNHITGSRVNALMEKAKDLDMRAILIDGGILK